MRSSAGILRYLCSKPVRLVHGAIIRIKIGIGTPIAFEAAEVSVPSKSPVRGLGFHIAVPGVKYWGVGTFWYIIIK